MKERPTFWVFPPFCQKLLSRDLSTARGRVRRTREGRRWELALALQKEAKERGVLEVCLG